MSFRKKLFYFFIAIAFLSGTIALVIVYAESSRLLFREKKRQITSLSLHSERLVKIGLLTKLQQQDQWNRQGSQNMHDNLLEIVQFNHRFGLEIKSAYLLKRGQTESQLVLLASSASTSVYHKPYPSHLQLPQIIDHPLVTTHFYSDQDGTFLSAYLPVRNLNGEELALLGLDLPIQTVNKELKLLLIYGCLALFFSVIVAIISATLLSRVVSGSLSELCETVRKIGSGDFKTRSHLETQDEFCTLSQSINQMAKGLEERERLKVGFTRYVSHYALEELLKLDQPITLKGERKKVTLLFSDIRQFTTLAENLPPEQVLQLLNDYFEEMIEIVFHYGGTLDKFMGDGMMVEFGAPLNDAAQERHALLTAIGMHLRLAQLNNRWAEEGKPTLEIGIGLHTGLAVLGNIGSERRTEYTAIGDAVNVAARLEGKAKQLSRAIILSETVYSGLDPTLFQVDDLGPLQIPGREQLIHAYALDPFLKQNRLAIKALDRESPDEHL